MVKKFHIRPNLVVVNLPQTELKNNDNELDHSSLLVECWHTGGGGGGGKTKKKTYKQKSKQKNDID